MPKLLILLPACILICTLCYVLISSVLTTHTWTYHNYWVSPTLWILRYIFLITPKLNRFIFSFCYLPFVIQIKVANHKNFVVFTLFLSSPCVTYLLLYINFNNYKRLKYLLFCGTGVRTPCLTFARQAFLLLETLHQHCFVLGMKYFLHIRLVISTFMMLFNNKSPLFWCYLGVHIVIFCMFGLRNSALPCHKHVVSRTF
jgi:hypothetical protein